MVNDLYGWLKNAKLIVDNLGECMGVDDLACSSCFLKDTEACWSASTKKQLAIDFIKQYKKENGHATIRK